MVEIIEIIGGRKRKISVKISFSEINQMFCERPQGFLGEHKTFTRECKSFEI